VAGVEVVHVSRHGAGHAQLSNHVDHRANLCALLDAGVNRLIALTACGSVDPAVPAGSLVVFDDFYFPSNRLPDGSLCTWYTEPGQPGRGHWVFDEPFSAPIRRALLEAAAITGVPVVEGCYGHVDGPRFNSRAEVAALAAARVTAVSQTAGPEVVLAGEAELPTALLGYVTDGVAEAGEPAEELMRRVAESRGVLAAVVEAALPALGDADSAGVVHRFDAG
jgi:5'-methylthioadenosine phosphorylase